MTQTISHAAVFEATDQSVPDGTERRVVFALMQSAKGWFQHKPSVQLAAICKCDVKTAERYFAGDRTPNGEAIIAMLRSEVGVKMVVEATRDLPPKEFDAFWKSMAKATLFAMARGEGE